MLILTRRPGEAICIGDDIEILIKEVRRNHVRIGINAPKHIEIRRADSVSSDASRDDSTDSVETADADESDSTPETS